MFVKISTLHLDLSPTYAHVEKVGWCANHMLFIGQFFTTYKIVGAMRCKKIAQLLVLTELNSHSLLFHWLKPLISEGERKQSDRTEFTFTFISLAETLINEGGNKNRVLRENP